MLVLFAGCDQAFGLERDEVVLVCPASFREVGGAYYRRVDDTLTWHQAEAACEALSEPETTGQTHLAVIARDDELAAVIGNLTITGFWLGHTDLATDGTFVPTTPQSVTWPTSAMPPWAVGQPNNNGGNQDCLWVDGNGLLDDRGCTSDNDKARFVCECDLFPSTAPLPP